MAAVPLDAFVIVAAVVVAVSWRTVARTAVLIVFTVVLVGLTFAWATDALEVGPGPAAEQLGGRVADWAAGLW